MTRIDFYLLPDGSDAASGAVMATCKLCDKATSVGHKVYVHTPDAAVAENLDGALWSFRQGSFIAHEKHSGQSYEDPQPMVLIGSIEPPETHHNIMINLGTEVPAFFSRFERVLEIVDGDPALRAKSRERFKFYRDRGYELNTFEQNADGGWAKRN
jgi:DNA polymerase-3 subunit chi